MMNRKGFTLIELLAVILITSLVLGLTTYGIISAVNSAKEKSITLSLKNVKEGARTYSSENSTDRWKDGTGNNTYFCVTVEELINKGLLDKKAKNIEDGGSLVNYIAVIKDKTTKVIKNELLLKEKPVDDGSDEYSEAYSLCTGDVKAEEIVTSTQLKNTMSYTDTITTEFEDAVFKKDNEEINIIEKYCHYGKDTSNITNSDNTKIEGNTCIIDSLKQEEDYYVKVCVKSESSAISCTNPKSVTTDSITKPTININGENNIKIIYSDDNIYNKEGASYYFKSSSNGTSNKNVSTCTLDNNMYTCNSDSTISIMKDTWYKTSDKEIILTYQDTGNIKLTAETRDKSNNSKSSEKEFSLYKITFNKGNADSINSQTSNIEKMCLADKNKSCKITSPTIAKEGYNVIGWNTNSSATSSSWNVNVEKDISKSDTYYPIMKIKTYIISYNANGGSGVPSNQTKEYGVTLTLSNTKPTRNGYTFIGWNTTSNGMGTSYSSGATYEGNNNLTLYAQWKYKTIKVTLDNQSATTSGTSIVYYQYNTTKKLNNIICYYYNDSNLTDCLTDGYTISKPTKTGYTFKGYYTGKNGTGTQYINENGTFINSLYSNNEKDITLYAYWQFKTYNLTLTKGTGISTIYYKVSTASNYSSSSSNRTITNISYGTTYYYYGVSSGEYSMNSCTSSSPCSVTITNNISKSLSASDKVAPSISASVYSGGSLLSTTTSGNTVEYSNWLNKQVTVVFTASDGGSGVNANITEYYGKSNTGYPSTSGLSSSGNTFSNNNTYTKNITDEGYSQVGIKVCDNSSNCSTFYVKFKLDTTAPSATLSADYSDGSGSVSFTSSGNTFRNDTWLNKLITLKLTPSDNLSGVNSTTTFSWNRELIPSIITDSSTIKTILDSQTLSLSSGKFTRGISSPGQRYVTYNLCDVAGNCVTKEVYFKLDIYTPTLIYKRANGNWRYFACSSLSGLKEFRSSENGSVAGHTTDNSIKDEYKHWWDPESDTLWVTCESQAKNRTRYELVKSTSEGYCEYTTNSAEYVNGSSTNNPCNTSTTVCNGTQILNTDCKYVNGKIQWKQWKWVEDVTTESYNYISSCIGCVN